MLPEPGKQDHDTDMSSQSFITEAGRRMAAVQPWVSTAARLVLAGVLGYAGLSKVAEPASSVQAVAAYELFGDEINTLIGFSLPFLELALAALLLAGLATRYAGAASGALMLVFIAGIVSAWARGLSIDCGCFGDGGPVAPGEEDYLTPLLRDVGFLLPAGILMAWPRSVLSLDRLIGLDTDPIKDTD